jgi:hypothetical protein
MHKIDFNQRYIGITHNQLNSIQNEIYLLPSLCGYCSIDYCMEFYHISGFYILWFNFQ